MPFLARRLLMTLPTLLGAAILIFIMLRVVPGDIVELKMLGDGAAASPEEIAAERIRLGLDQPMIVQFLLWLKGILSLDFGTSLWTQEPVAAEIGARLGVSVQIAIMATMISVSISLPLGVLAALKQGSVIDHAIRLFTVVGLAVPVFWMGMLIILVLLAGFSWLPPVVFVPFHEAPLTSLLQTAGPALAVGLRFSAMGTRMTRATMLEVLREDYIRTARAKGLTSFRIIVTHALKNALLPVLTVLVLEFAFLLAGLVVIEQVFNINGIGRLMVQSVLRADYPVVQGIVLLMAATFVTANLIVDLLYLRIDPRIRYK